MSNTFAKRLKELRKEAGITQIEFARKFNIANGTVGNWESGNRQPDYATVQKIADFFKVSVDYLVREETEGNAEIKKSPSEISEGEEKLLDLLRKIPESQYPMVGLLLESFGKIPESQQPMVLQMIDVALKNLK